MSKSRDRNMQILANSFLTTLCPKENPNDLSMDVGMFLCAMCKVEYSVPSCIVVEWSN